MQDWLCLSYVKLIILPIYAFYRRYFDCACARCSSKDELGTHLSSLLCDVCKDGDGGNSGGIMLCDSPLDAQSGLTCQSCGIQKPQNLIDQLESDLESRLEDIKSDKNLLAEALSSYRGLLHPNHYLIVAMER